MRGKICAERTQTKAHPHAHTMTQARRQTGSERCAYADVPDSHFIMMACCEDPLIAAAPLHAYRPVCDVSRHTHKRKENRERERERDTAVSLEGGQGGVRLTDVPLLYNCGASAHARETEHSITSILGTPKCISIARCM
jgi:hypothetical protein